MDFVSWCPFFLQIGPIRCTKAGEAAEAGPFGVPRLYNGGFLLCESPAFALSLYGALEEGCPAATSQMLRGHSTHD
jgi:hypothetical protein